MLGFSIVTDMCLPDALKPVRIEEIIAVANEAEAKLRTIVRGVLGTLERLTSGRVTMSTNTKPYKETLNLPATRFDMKANLPVREPQIQARWREQDLYAQVRQAAPAGRGGSCTTARRTPTARSTWAPCSTRCSRTSSSDR